jgi:hypothetical protein
VKNSSSEFGLAQRKSRLLLSIDQIAQSIAADVDLSCAESFPRSNHLQVYQQNHSWVFVREIAKLTHSNRSDTVVEPRYPSRRGHS